MAGRNQKTQRLYIDAPLPGEGLHGCTREQANYLVNVLRMEAGDGVLVFNGRDGEWRAKIGEVKRGQCLLVLEERVRAQKAGPDIHYLFAPLKRARLDYMVQKATEMGASHLRPVLTNRTNSHRVKLERMRANAIEAAEQCGVMTIPEVSDPVKLSRLLDDWEPSRALIYCDEAAPISSPLEALAEIAEGPAAILIGPEGGFDKGERELLRAQTFVTAISLGPRVMRADTAAVAALALVNAVLGDWK